jgi:hypothetical protein
MDITEFRKTLAVFVGADRFRKFVQQFHRAGRLRYWQEEVWGQFVAAHPEFSCSVEELWEALWVCELHGCDLQPDEVGVIHGCVDYADWYIKAKIRLFPNAATEPFSTEGRPYPGRTARVWFCAACRAAEAAWQDRRDR